MEDSQMTNDTDNTDSDDDDDDNGLIDFHQLTPHPSPKSPSDLSRKLSKVPIGGLNSEEVTTTLCDGRIETRDIDDSDHHLHFEDDFYLQDTAEDIFEEAEIPQEDISSIWMSLFSHCKPSVTGEELGELVIHLVQEGWEKHTDELVLALYCAHKDFEIMNTGEVYVQDTGEGVITSMKTDIGWTEDRFLPLDDLLSIKEHHSLTDNKFKHRTE